MEEKRSKEALLLVQQQYTMWNYQNQRGVARRLQRFGNTRRMKKEADYQDFFSFNSCRSSVVDQVEEMSLESPRKIQDVQMVMSETAGKATRGRGEDAWRLEPQGGTETLENKVVSNGVEGVHVDPNGEGHHERDHVNNSRRQSDASGEEGEEIRSPKRKVIRVESEETLDYVREANDLNQKEGEEISFVPSAISVPQKPLFRCDNHPNIKVRQCVPCVQKLRLTTGARSYILCLSAFQPQPLPERPLFQQFLIIAAIEPAVCHAGYTARHCHREPLELRPHVFLHIETSEREQRQEGQGRTTFT